MGSWKGRSGRKQGREGKKRRVGILNFCTWIVEEGRIKTPGEKKAER